MDVLRSAMLFDFLIAQSLVTAINAEVKPDQKPEKHQWLRLVTGLLDPCSDASSYDQFNLKVVADVGLLIIDMTIGQRSTEE